eukprot:TRINITY_DN7683_c0_g3_i1.p1 TRINITY_DN7683_c0_g3~~TRINITY_DN7683_c0_g3_i1.p1  ORF type:complete len:193 (+),score=29.91 TRINITY_DN7683_c0_g3_i1:61-579(+)
MCKGVSAPTASIARGTPMVDVVACILEDVVRKGVEAGNKEKSVYDGVRAPNVSIKGYLERWVQYSGCDTEVVIMAVIYIDRLCTGKKITITKTNAHRLLLSCLVVATKWRQDRVHANSHYANVGGVTHNELNHLERCCLNDLEWSTHIESSTFQKYYKQFRQHRVWKLAAQE